MLADWYFACRMELCERAHRDEMPRNIYILAVGIVWEYLVVRGQVNVSEEAQISELWKKSGHKGLGK